MLGLGAKKIVKYLNGSRQRATTTRPPWGILPKYVAHWRWPSTHLTQQPRADEHAKSRRPGPSRCCRRVGLTREHEVKCCEHEATAVNIIVENI